MVVASRVMSPVFQQGQKEVLLGLGEAVQFVEHQDGLALDEGRAGWRVPASGALTRT